MAKDAKPPAKTAGKPKGSGGSAAGFVIALAVLSPVAGGGGFMFATQVLGPPAQSQEKKGAAEEAAEAADDPAADHGKNRKEAEAPAATGDLVVLPPIITNLASPPGAFLRLEGTILVEEGYADGAVLAVKVSEDIVAFLRTIPLSQLQGASAMNFLREDINDRLRVRSEGKARELIITSLVIE